MLLRKQQRDVDVDAFIQTGFDGGPSLACARDLLTMTLTRATASQSRRAWVIEPFVSRATAGDTSRDTNPSVPRSRRTGLETGRQLRGHRSPSGRRGHVLVRGGRRNQSRQFGVVARTPGDGFREDGGI